jgi:type 1 glutamine amidotransferase
MNSKLSRRHWLAGAALAGVPWNAAAMESSATGSGAISAPAARLRVLILTGGSDLPYHHWRESTEFLRGVLERTGRFDVKVEEEVGGISPATLRPFDVLVLNYNGPRWGAQAEGAIEAFVRGGKGLVSFHGVTYGQFFGMVYDGHWKASPTGDRGWAAYADLIGADWDPPKIGHGARHVFPVKWVDREHPVSQGLEESFQANDELYHRLDLKPRTHVLATAFSEPASGGTERDEPIIWTTGFGQGRTLHLTLGHDLSALHQTGFLTAFARGLEWAATGAVTLPARIEAEAHAANPVRVLVATGGHPYPTAFYTLFEGYDDIVWQHATTQREAFTRDMAAQYDALVLHDMYDQIGEPERDNLRAFIEAGKGIVSVHHAIVDYTSWPWFYEQVIGGKFFVQAVEGHAASAWKEGVDYIVRPTQLGASHPVTRGIGPIPLHDEVYRGMWQAPGIQVLMETDHPLNDRPVVYTGLHPKARSVYVQMGHSASTHRHPAYRRLIYNALVWSAGRGANAA